MSNHLLLHEYKQAYLAFVAALAQTTVVSSVVEVVLVDFPRRLPPDLRSAVTVLFQEVGEALLQAVGALAEKSSSNGSEAKGPRIPKAAERDEPGKHPKYAQTFAVRALEVMLSQPDNEQQRSLGDAVGQQFQSLARRQAVAMIFAHLDAFLSDTLRVVCRAQPNVPRTNKQLTWAIALQFSTIDDLVNYLIEQLIYEFGWKTVNDRIMTLRDRFGIEFDIPQQKLELIRLYEQRRHIIIHNGGIVTPRYVQETADNEARVGEPLAIPPNDVDRLAGAVKTLGSEVCVAVAIKFLGAKDKDLTRIWRTQNRKDDSEN